jgi:release factor glutamine methyltransferase
MAPLTRGVTIAQARRALAETFRRADIDSPELDARLLAGHALNLDHTGLATQDNRALSESEVQALNALAIRRIDREPVARIIGIKEFWGLPLHLNAATLVPRPETETVVEVALTSIETDGPRSRALRIADLGTGTGALLLALLSELPNATGLGTDISSEALIAAQGNADRLGFGVRAQFIVRDFTAALSGGFDLVVSNPPYIPSGDIAALPSEVRRDPPRALDGGADGLNCYRAIARQAPHLLKPGGHVVVELGIGQEPEVAALFRSAGLAPSPARTDLAGIPRALHARVATMMP